MRCVIQFQWVVLTSHITVHLFVTDDGTTNKVETLKSEEEEMPQNRKPKIF
jgi:hypothetical protein